MLYWHYPFIQLVIFSCFTFMANTNHHIDGKLFTINGYETKKNIDANYSVYQGILNGKSGIDYFKNINGFANICPVICVPV